MPIQIPLRAHTPEKIHRALDAGCGGMLDDGLDRRKASTTSDQDDWTLRLFAQKKRPKRAAQTHKIFFLHLVEHMVGEETAWYMPHVQFQRGVVVRSVG